MERDSNEENREKLCLKLFSLSPDILFVFSIRMDQFYPENKEEFLII